MVTTREMRKLKGDKALGMRLTAHKFDIGKALTLRIVKHLSYKHIATILNTTASTVRQGLLPLLSLIDNPDLVKGFRHHEVDLLDGIRMLAMRGIGEQLSNPKRRQKMDMSRLSTLYGIMFDKQRLIRGESTANINQLTAIIIAAHKDKGNKAIDIEAEGVEAVVLSMVAICL